jgi:hypothetical protein
MIQVRISPAQRRKLESELNHFAKKAGVAVGETVAIIGGSVAKELARKVQPFGLTQKTGTAFELSIVKQVNKAARYAVYKGTQGDISQVHSQYRNRRGAVVVRPPRQFQPERKVFDRQEVDAYAEKKKSNAGIAKAGWIAAGESIDSPLLKTTKGRTRKIKGIGKWIRRHVNSNKGTSRFVRKGGLNSTIYLTNKVDYAYSRNNANMHYTPSAIADGYKRSITTVKRLLKSLK